MPGSEPDSGKPTVRDRRGGPGETWAKEKANRAREAETPKQPSFNLRSSAPQLYPDNGGCRVTGSPTVMAKGNENRYFKQVFVNIFFYSHGQPSKE